MIELKIDNEFRALIPSISDSEYNLLEESILSEGCRDDLVVWDDTILDGHNRYEICNKHGMAFNTKPVDLDSRDDAKIWIIKNQFGRRNLSMFQRSELALELKPLLVAKAKENQGTRTDIPKNSWESTQEVEIKEIWDNKVYDYDTKARMAFDVRQKYGREIRRITNAAESLTYIAITANKIKIGVSTTPEARIDQLKTSDPDIALIDIFSNGRELEKLLLKKFSYIALGGEWFTFTEENLKKILGYARQEDARLNEVDVKIAKVAGVSHDTVAKVKKIIEKAPGEVKQSIRNSEISINKAYKDIVRKENRDKRKQQIIETPLPTDIYNILYADPPWRYEHSETKSRDIENQYPTMDLEDIKALKIPSADNAVLLLWATSPKLEEALQVINAWGFSYRTCAVWDKEIIGMGYWFRGQHELLLLGIKGNMPTPDPELRVSSVYHERRQEHSKKPDYYYDLIEKYFPNGKYLELFARAKHNDKWAVWGNESTSS